MDDKTIQAIEAILKRGNDAKVRRKGGGYVVIEIRETIKHSAPRIVAEQPRDKKSQSKGAKAATVKEEAPAP